MPHPNGLLTHAELTTIGDEDLVRRIDQLYAGTPSDWRLLLANLLRDELLRRGQERATAAMLRWTRQVRNMTVAILVLTIVNIVIVLLSVWTAR